jgi:hypothetical protein
MPDTASQYKHIKTKTTSRQHPQHIDNKKLRGLNNFNYFCIPFTKGVHWHLGLTGFDSKMSGYVSMPSRTIKLVKLCRVFIIGENNYALAA